MANRAPDVPEILTAPSLSMQAALELAAEAEQSQAGYAFTWEAFQTAGKSQLEHQLWRQSELPELLHHWTLLGEAFLNQKSTLGREEWIENEEGILILEQEVAHKELRLPRGQVEYDIATWYLENQRANGFTVPGIYSNVWEELSPSVRYFYWSHTRAEDSHPQIEIDEQVGGQRKDSSEPGTTAAMEKKTRKGNLPEPTWGDLEAGSLTAKEVVSDCLGRPRTFKDRKNKNPEHADPEPTSQGLSTAVDRTISRSGIDRSKPLERPIRVTKTISSFWWRYAVVALGAGSGPGQGHKYSIIKNQDEEVTTEHNHSLTK
jgi:hypothetical protein